MALIQVALALCASLCVANAQFNPNNPVPVCRGPGLIGHQTYCTLFYSCLKANEAPVEMQCGAGTVWDNSGCGQPYSLTACPAWSCNGGNYPDLCCDKYWTCSTSVNNGQQRANTWTRVDCPAGTTFDIPSGQCVNQGSALCVENSRYCVRNFVPNPNFQCTLFENPSDPNKCTYLHSNSVMDCPSGLAFDPATCGCTQRTAAGVCDNRFPFAENKANDNQCRASFRVQFDDARSLTAYSDKVNLLISPAVTSTGSNLQYGGGFYLGAKGAVTVSGNEAQLSTNGFIYSNYFANNEMHAPVAIVIEFRPSSFMTGETFELLSNTFEITGNQLCNNSLTVNVRNDGFTNVGNGQFNDYRYTFSVSLNGKTNLGADVFASINDLTIVVPQSVTSGVAESGSSANYLRFLLTLSGATANAQVVELNGNVNTQFANVVSKSAAFSVAHLRRTQCGLTVGSSMQGSVRTYTVYEGCNNGFSGLLTN